MSMGALSNKQARKGLALWMCQMKAPVRDFQFLLIFLTLWTHIHLLFSSEYTESNNMQKSNFVHCGAHWR